MDKLRLFETFLLLVLLFFLFPLPGVSSTQYLNVSNVSTSVELVDVRDLSSNEDGLGTWGEYRGIGDGEAEVVVATRGWPLFQFLSVCSHELQHVQGLSHSEMSVVGDFIVPWEWERECLGLVDSRLALSS